jgi:hypothetical protein
MEKLMSLRLPVTIITALALGAGLSASAYSLTQGATDQAIAFGWPVIALAVIMGFVIPARRSSRRG